MSGILFFIFASCHPLNIAYIQGFHLMVTKFVCVSYVTVVLVRILVTRITQWKDMQKMNIVLNSPTQESNKHTYFMYTILSLENMGDKPKI